MKKTQLILFLMIIILFQTFYSLQTPKSKFKKGIVRTDKYQLKVIYESTVNISNLKIVLDQIEKSSDSDDFEKISSPSGLFGQKDLIVITQKLLLWFALSKNNEGRKIKSGGGLLGGIWEVQMNGSNPSIKSQKLTYYPNLLLPGSSPNTKRFPGADIYGAYPTYKLIWGIEYSTDTREGINHGKDILSVDKGPFSAEGGIFVQFTGTLRNSKIESGFETFEDTDPRPGKVGKTIYTLTYRIPENRPEFIQEVQFKVEENHFGPISNAIMALYLPNYNTDFVYATNPEVIPVTKEMDLSHVNVNKYFKNSCVKKVFFYNMTNKNHSGNKYVAQTPPGRGKIVCLGSPENKVSFVCGYPTNDYIPKNTFEEYVLEISDNQTNNERKFTSISYKLLSSPNKVITLKQGEQLLMIMRYKFIDASAAVAPKKER